MYLKRGLWTPLFFSALYCNVAGGELVDGKCGKSFPTVFKRLKYLKVRPILSPRKSCLRIALGKNGKYYLENLDQDGWLVVLIGGEDLRFLGWDD